MAASPAAAGAEPTLQRVRVNGVALAWFEWNASLRGRGASVLLLHATGFHARCWDPIVRRLGAVHAIALDQRGHGRSEKPPITDWKAFGDDVAAFVRERAETFVAAGHSMGGHALVDAAAACPERFARLVLIDPVIGSPEHYAPGGGWRAPLAPGELHPSAKRKRHFDSPRAMFERFRDRRPYSLFTEEALWAYCEHGLLPRSDGPGFELACPPEIEASIYMTSRSHPGVIENARRVRAPTLVVRAKDPPPERGIMDFESSPTWPGLAAAMPNARDLQLPAWTHFVPMQAPELVAEWLAAELRAAS